MLNWLECLTKAQVQIRNAEWTYKAFELMSEPVELRAMQHVPVPTAVHMLNGWNVTRHKYRVMC
jgi:hypothetical protein